MGSGKLPGFLFFCIDKFRNTALKLRLATLDIGNYAVALLTRFALSCEISRRKIYQINSAILR